MEKLFPKSDLNKLLAFGAVEKWINDIRYERTGSMATIRTYLQVLSHFCEFIDKTPDDLVKMDPSQIRESIKRFAMQAERQWKRGDWNRRTAHNGGSKINSAFKIIGENELVPLLEQGYEIVKELSNGKIVVKKQREA